MFYQYFADENCVEIVSVPSDGTFDNAHLDLNCVAVEFCEI